MATDLRKYARGQPCMVRVGGICNSNSETTVLAHLGGAGMGRKHHDIHGAWCCDACHSYVDGRGPVGRPEHRRVMLLDGIMRTQERLIRDGKIIID